MELTFKDVGDTPDNKYEVFVDKSTKLVTQWAFFKTYEAETAQFITPWNDYESHGKILLSGNRGKGNLTNIAVRESVKETVFREL